jgi:hypothetical protein
MAGGLSPKRGKFQTGRRSEAKTRVESGILKNRSRSAESPTGQNLYWGSKPERIQYKIKATSRK